jgi:hypothetical protein
MSGAIIMKRVSCGSSRTAGLARYLTAAVRAVRVTGTCKQQSEVIVDLGYSADCRPGIAAGPFLVDGDSGTEAVDIVDVGLLHPAQELAGVGGEGLDITTLSLRIDSIEGERAFPRSRDTGDYDELVPGYGDVYVLKVVLPGALNNYGIKRHMVNSLKDG